MGTYVDPGYKGFQEMRTSDVFVDVSGVIAVTNSMISKTRKRLCVARPRRFGKSVTLSMLNAYYKLWL